MSFLNDVMKYVDDLVGIAVDYWPVAVIGVVLVCMFIIYKMVMG